MELMSHVFKDVVAKRILQIIPLCPPQQDEMRWQGTPNGKFNVNSAYWLLCAYIFKEDHPTAKKSWKSKNAFQMESALVEGFVQLPFDGREILQYSWSYFNRLPHVQSRHLRDGQSCVSRVRICQGLFVQLLIEHQDPGITTKRY